jgi:hypothetical protein
MATTTTAAQGGLAAPIFEKAKILGFVESLLSDWYF